MTTPGAAAAQKANDSMTPLFVRTGLAVLVSVAVSTGCTTGRSGDHGGGGASTLASIGIYPPARTVDVVDDYHGTLVADPYRWLEEYSDDTNRWIDENEAFTRGYLDAIPERAAIKARLERLWNYERFGLPRKAGDRYVLSRNDGLQNQNVLYVADRLDGPQRVLLDPNTMSKDGTIAIGATSITDDGRLLAYSVAEAGSDWNVIRVRDIATGRDLPDEVRWVKFSGASWLKDGSGFFYSRFDAPADGDTLKAVNEYHKIYFHTLGTPQSEDVLVFERKDQPRWYVGGGVTDDGRFLVIGIASGETVNDALAYKDLARPDAPVVMLLDRFDAKYRFLGNDGSTFYVQSDLDAPRGRIWAIDIERPDRSHWRELIPQSEHTLVEASIVGDRIFCNYLADAKSLVRVHALDGSLVGEVPLPGICTADGFGGRRSDRETFFSVGSYTIAPSIYRYDLATGETSLVRRPNVPFDSDRYETKQIFFTSKDGTRVPMFVTHRKGLAYDGTNPTVLYGYGGFNISITPSFSPARCAWLEMGGVWVEANLRGGGEYGDAWHRGGMQLTKQNTFDDCIAAAEWLIANKVTSPERLGLQGGSNGGLLVGACMTQRPELWGACVPAVGVLDMLRFQKFTIGWGWIGDYGSSDDPEQFKVLYGYSPYHNIRSGICYPPTLITTGDHDDRVHPAHSFKFAARLQETQSNVQGCRNPILLRIDKRAGHGAGKPTSKRIEEAADVTAFLATHLGVGASK
jgi:prolyl oligopeptidase